MTAVDLLSALIEVYDASSGVPGLDRLWIGAAPDAAILPYAVLRVASSRIDMAMPERDAFATVLAVETYAGDSDTACELGDALGAILTDPDVRLVWAGGAATRIRPEGDPSPQRDFRRAKKGQELWYQSRRLIVHTIEDRPA